MQDWVYPVNSSSTEKWGYERGPVEMFGSRELAGIHAWELGSGYAQMQVGDRVWVYATQPVSQIIAVGLVERGPWWWAEEQRWFADLRWDAALTRKLLRDSPGNVLDTRVQTVRRLTEAEFGRLIAHLAGDGIKDLPELPRGRLRRLQEVTQRQGQPEFRRRLLVAYDGRCAISGCDVDAVLEAAHIDRYDGPASNQVTNGLLLRADLHTLFDAGLLWVDVRRTVRLHVDLHQGQYAEFEGARLRQPAKPEDRADPEALRRHRETVAVR